MSTGALEGVEVTYEKTQKVTWYNPKVDLWKMYDVRILPGIAKADSGARKLVVTILVQEPGRGRPTSLQVDTGEESWFIPISESDPIKTHDSGCRLTQTIYLQNQAAFVEKVAGAARAEIALVGYERPVHYRMTAEDLSNFKRIATLWKAPALPGVSSKPSSENAPASPAPTKSVFTNPELIPSSKVPPRFPNFAEGKRAYGRVVLQAVIRKDGTVGEIEVKQGAGGDCGFEESAIEAVRRWRYKPATKDGQPIDIYFKVVVDFVYSRDGFTPTHH